MAVPHYNTLKNALERFGIDHQSRMAIEECSELQNAICKLYRGRATDKEVITEIADVIIMCLQMAIHFGVDKVRDEIEYKIDRLQKLLDDDLQHKQQTHERSRGIRHHK